MRLAAVAVGSAILGSSVVLFSLSPVPATAPRAEVIGGEPRVQPVPQGVSAAAANLDLHPGSSGCPPCRDAPLAASEWRERLAGVHAPPAATWDRATVLSLAYSDHEGIADAFEQAEPAQRELAALLLNVASERIVGCSPLPASAGTATDVLDALDRMVATVRSGEPVSQADLTLATAAAHELNEGPGGPAACATRTVPPAGRPATGAADR